MTVTVSGIVTDVISLFPSNAFTPILVTATPSISEGITNSVIVPLYPTTSPTFGLNIIPSSVITTKDARS